MMFIVFFFLYARKRKSGNYELEDVDAASDLSEKDRMLREKEAEVLNWFEIIPFYSLPRKRIIIPHKTIIKTTTIMQKCALLGMCLFLSVFSAGVSRLSGGHPGWENLN